MGHFLSAAPQLDLPLGKNINFVQLGHNYIESACCDKKRMQALWIYCK